MDRSAFLASIEELFEATSGSLTGTERIEGIPGWCSLVFVGLIAMIDEEYEVTVDPNSLLQGQTLDGLYDLIEREVAAKKRAA